MHMPQIGRKVGQPPLDIGALLIPGHEAMDSGGVAQIVEAGLIPCAVVATHLRLYTYPAEGPFSLLARDGRYAQMWRLQQAEEPETAGVA